MNPEFWQQRWQRGELGWHEDDFNRHLAEHWPGLGVAPAARVFVPLSGKSLDMLWLAGRGHRVLGVEISEVAAVAFCDENGLSPQVTDEPPFRRYAMDEIEILVGDFFDLIPAHLADVGAVYDRASLIALAAGDATALCGTSGGAVARGGSIAADYLGLRSSAYGGATVRGRCR